MLWGIERSGEKTDSRPVRGRTGKLLYLVSFLGQLFLNSFFLALNLRLCSFSLLTSIILLTQFVASDYK